MIRLLCLSADPTLLRRAVEVFSENSVQAVCHETTTEFISNLESSPWDAYFVDLDLLNASNSDPLTLLSRLYATSKKMIVVVASNLGDWHKELERYGALVLDKPLTTGEIVLALRRVISEQN